MHKFKYDWKMSENYPKKNGCKVFSTFACGGGSTMGYKLAGFDVIGCNDIDKKMTDLYVKNHKPKHVFTCTISELKNKKLPEEFFNLDILDGSPPCSTFSISGNREKDWKKDRVFREGQAKQKLSDLFFEFIDLAEYLKPKVIIAENVKGMIMGNAKAYTSAVLKQLDAIGYDVQLFCLNASTMGVPQRRERVFFIAVRKDLKMEKLILNFNEKAIKLGEFIKPNNGKALSRAGKLYADWQKRKRGDKNFGDICLRTENKQKSFGRVLISSEQCAPTIVSGNLYIYFEEFKAVSNKDHCKISTFPSDYDFNGNNTVYVCGMSVPPVMMAQVASQVYEQWLSKLK